MNLRLAFATALLLTPLVSQANSFLPSDVREALIAGTLNGFWGHARDSRGNTIQPASEAERKELPISRQAADRAVTVGETSGLAEWCGIAWEESLRNLTGAARQQGRTDKQVAFLAALHGATLQAVSSSMTRSGRCDESTREKVKVRVEQMQRARHDL